MRTESLLRAVGIVLILMGAISSGHFLGMYYWPIRPIVWTQDWGVNSGWAIRGGLLALGATMYFLTPTGDR